MGIGSLHPNSICGAQVPKFNSSLVTPRKKKTQKPCFLVGYSWIMLDKSNLSHNAACSCCGSAVDLFIMGPRKTSMDDFKPIWKSSQIACASSTSMACLQAGRFCSAKLASTCRHSGSWLPRSKTTHGLIQCQSLEPMTFRSAKMEI